MDTKFTPPLIVLFLLLPTLAHGGYWDKISVTTYNIHSGTDASNTSSINSIANALISTQADVFALQEVSVKFAPPCGDNVADLNSRLWHAFPSNYPYSTFVPSETRPADLFMCGWGQSRRTGNAIYSKWPIIETWTLTLPTTWTPRNAIGAKIQRGSLQFIVYVTHLQNGDSRASDRLAQASAIANDVASRSLGALPIFVMGDFNCGSTWAELQPLRDVMWGPPGPIPPNADSGIDFGFFRPYSSVSETLFPSSASDHKGPVRLDWWFWVN